MIRVRKRKSSANGWRSELFCRRKSSKRARELLNFDDDQRHVIMLGRSLAKKFHFFDELIGDRKSTRLNSSHVEISYAVFCLKKKKKTKDKRTHCPRAGHTPEASASTQHPLDSRAWPRAVSAARSEAHVEDDYLSDACDRASC